ncbi:MAG: FG-GAP repeat protein, partial [Candidatus Thermoplasmatota archaeon]|nr:FG-GAP repeat protein [Candidatus Thermoplasmatota archaeon]
MVGMLLLSAFTMMNIIPTSAEENGVFGPIAGPGPRLTGTIDLYSGDKADQLFEGTTQYSYLGSSVTTGDLDGDGHDDYIIGAQGTSNDNGEVDIYFGIKNVHPWNDPNNANVTIAGTSTYGYFGMSLAVGDVNGDGIDDLLIGADGANNYAGEGYVFFGKTTWPKKVSLKASNADVIFKGDPGTYKSGYLGHFCGSGDIDGDGFDEVVFNAPEYTEEDMSSNYAIWGMTYIWWGRPLWNSVYDAAKGEYDTSVYGKQVDTTMYFDAWESLGTQRPFIGDMNGDGADELIVGGRYEAWFDSSDPSSYNYDCGGVHILEGTYHDRSRWPKDMTIMDLSEDDPDLPEHHWLYSDTSSDNFGCYVFGKDMNGDGNCDLVASKGSSSGTAYIFWGDGSLDSFGGGTWDTRIRYMDHPDYTTVAGPTNLHVDDFDNDGIWDLYGGSYYVNSPNGGLWLWYGSSDWGDSKGSSDADLTIKGNYYDYLGYYYYPCLSSGDFNSDDYPDLFFGAFYHQNSKTGLSYCGAAYVVLTVPPEMHLKSLELLDGDGKDHNILTPEAGGNRYEPTNSYIGDGVYTFKVEFNDTWTVVEAQEIELQFNLKDEFLGLSYDIAYSPVNETFFIYENLGGGLEIIPERSQFNILGYNDAEVYFGIRITSKFLTDIPFDVTAIVST